MEKIKELQQEVSNATTLEDLEQLKDDIHTLYFKYEK